MRISDWSSDVCSSDLAPVVPGEGLDPGVEGEAAAQIEPVGGELEVAQDLGLLGVARRPVPLVEQDLGERVAVVEALRVAPGAGAIGRASGRERVCQSV